MCAYVLGMILCVRIRELLRRGSEVVLVGNTLPAINDITVSELMSVLEDVAHFCPVIKASSLSLGQLACSLVHASCQYNVIPPRMVDSP